MTKSFSDPRYLKDDQYRTPDNLMARVALYDRFAQGPSLQDIRLDQAGIGKNQSVIDFGCGNALTWARAMKRGELPDDLTLVDLSAGMLASADELLGDATPTLIEHDLNEPLSLDRQFDTACAFHMLYHLAKPFEAMDEILRHIKKDGRGIIHLNAPDHLSALRKLIHSFEGTDPGPDRFIDGNPSAEAAKNYWRPKFVSCEEIDITQELHVTESGPVLNYILSIEILHGNRYQDPARREAFAEFLETKVAEAKEITGYLLIQTHSVLLKFSGKF